MENLSAVLYGKNDLRMEHYPPRDPNSNEVQIKVQRAGSCITDVHLLDAGSIGGIVITKPGVIGHEFCGVVTSVGSDVTNLKPGDRVTVDSLASCGFCPQCKRGHSNVCVNHKYHGIPPCHGGLARFATVVANSVFKIPDTMDFEEAAMMEPLAGCVNAVNRANVTMGDNVIVLGSGPIGLMMSQIARARGASIVCVTDIKPDRLKLARELGATHTVLFREDETDAQANAQKLREVIGEDIDIALECSGVPVCLQTSIYAVRPAGVVTIMGLGPDNVTLPFNDATIREIDIRGCVCNNFCFPTAIKLVASQKVKVKPIISHRLPLEDFPRAIDLVRNREVVKIIIDCSSE